MDPDAAKRHISHIFTRTETPVALGVLIALSLLSLVRSCVYFLLHSRLNSNWLDERSAKS